MGITDNTLSVAPIDTVNYKSENLIMRKDKIYNIRGVRNAI